MFSGGGGAECITFAAANAPVASRLHLRAIGGASPRVFASWAHIMRYILGLLAFLLQVSGVALAADTESPPHDLSKECPPVLGFLRCINLHTNAARNLQQTNFVVITEFYRMDRLGGDMLRYIVTEDGQTINSIDDGTGAVGDPHRKQLSKAELEHLRSAVDKLSRTNQYP